jgi:hypothetical protein
LNHTDYGGEGSVGEKEIDSVSNGVLPFPRSWKSA